MREAAPPVDTARSRGIPAARTSLIGREGALATLRALLLSPPARLLTITGVGGGGKTRLAQAVAADAGPAFDGRVFWVSLAPVDDGALVPRAIAAALGVQETPATPLLDTLAARLAGARSLLVLDNCEHLLDACAEIVEHLLTNCPDLCILATSREPLMVAGERQWRASPLTVPGVDRRGREPGTGGSEHEEADAVRLFVERAQAVAPGFRLTDGNAGTVAEICIRLEGIPLALELAAARVRVLSAQQILGRLDDVFRLLTGGSRVAPTRQQTLRAALDWSYDLLDDTEQAFFRGLAVFSGGFDLEAVDPPPGLLPEGRGSLPQPSLAALSLGQHQGLGGRGAARPGSPSLEGGGRGVGPSGLDLLTRLVDKSLVTVEDGGSVARYRLLEPVRQYAWQHLDGRGEVEAAQARHAAYFLALTERAAAAMRGPDQVAWLRRLAEEQDNLRAALRWAEDRDDRMTIARLAVALAPFWEVTGGMSEGRRWLDGASAATPVSPLPEALRVQALLAAGRLAFWQADLPAATERLTEALALAGRIDAKQAIAESLTWLGLARRRQGDFAEAERLLDQSLPLHEAVGDQPGAAWALFIRGMLASDRDDWPGAVRLLEESVARYRALGDVRFSGITGTMLGAILVRLGEADRAAGLLHESLTLCRAVGDRAFMLSGLLTLARMEAQIGRPVQALRLIGAAEALRTSLGATLPPVNQDTLDATLAIVGTQLGDAERAAAMAAGRTMTPDEAIAASMQLGVLQPDQPTIPAAAPVEPLTRREQEVARLLAQGATDRQIAAALSIAIGTAGVHVHNILGKLGLNSRWQVAEWAIASGLASASRE